MSLLKTPLVNRPDVHIYTFPADADADALAAEVAAGCAAHTYTGFFLPFAAVQPPVVRVVPLGEEAVYREATRLVCERLAQQDGSSSPREDGPATVAFRSGGAEERQALRVIQSLGN